ncbi:hypothetical protein ACMA1D_25295 [Streptomyces sp. 796.1]|uniref:hypothetical protein n=1 Tax=unclassified Streptomyces TaxID=2593676 RepID=UPI0032ED2EF7
MVLSVSAVLLLGIIVFLLVKRDGLKVLHVLACVMLGFYLAGSDMAPTIDKFGNNVANAIGDIKF